MTYSFPHLVAAGEFGDHVSFIRWSCGHLGTFLIHLVCLHGKKSWASAWLPSPPRSLPLEFHFQRQRQMQATWAFQEEGPQLQGPRSDAGHLQSREIASRNFLFKAQGFSMCTAYALSQVLRYNITPAILTTNLQAGLLNLFQRAGNRQREVGIGLLLSKGSECGFELATLWFQSLWSFPILLTHHLDSFSFYRNPLLFSSLPCGGPPSSSQGQVSAAPQLDMLISEYKLSVTCCSCGFPGCLFWNLRDA